VARAINGKLINVVEISDTDSGINQKPDITAPRALVLPYDVNVSQIKEESDGKVRTVKVKAGKFEKNEKTGLYEYKEYEY
jgi:hypothetical protein